jgi:glutathione S-transferase
MTAVLVGQLDSPYVRRVAVSAAVLGIGFELRPWSVGKDQAQLRTVNPAGRVPAWIDADGAVFTESAQIVDHLDDIAGTDPLLPADPALRREVRQWLGLVAGVLDKGIAIVTERIFQPAAMHGSPWTTRCRDQLDGALVQLEHRCAGRAGQPWLVGASITQADIAFACALTYLRDALPLDFGGFPALAARRALIEGLPEFAATYTPFDAPNPITAERAP